MYSSFANHSSHMIRYIIVFFMLFIFLPHIFFTKGQRISLENFFKNYIKAVLFFIILSFLLIILKLYELLTLFVVIIYVSLYWYRRQKRISNWEDLWHQVMIKIYDFLDGMEQPGRKISVWLHEKKIATKNIIINRFGSIVNCGQSLIFVLVFAYSAFLRFYNTLNYAAPAMSDAYVVIAWIKYIDRKMLFHDGIYPQGFHMYLDFLHKFSAVDPLYIVNYSGPLHGVFITLSLYFVVSRWTGRKGPGILSAIIYGILSMYLPIELMRQAATNSQEFAFIFVMPVLYFFFNYMWSGAKDDLIAATAALFIIGLVHPVAFSFVGLGMGLLIFHSFINGLRKYLHRIKKVILVGLSSILVPFIPIGLGLLMGRDFYGASAEFLLRKEMEPVLPLLKIIEYYALIAILIIFIYQIIKRRKEKEIFAIRYVMLLGIASFLLYYYGGVVTKNVVISTRAKELWGLIIPVLLGTAWYCITDLVSPLKYKGVELLASFSLLVYIVIYINPQPIMPYKMEYDSGVEQYLRISTMLQPTEWMAVSQEEGYAVVYGKGYHLMLGEFLEMYDPNDKELKGCPPDVFIYYEKKVFWPDLSNNILDYSKYERREQENKELKIWLETYEKRYDNISTFYEDENLKIVRIQQTLDREEELEKIWGN